MKLANRQPNRSFLIIHYSMDFAQEDGIRLTAALLLGGLIGAERDCHGKATGFRTMIMVCVGSAPGMCLGGGLYDIAIIGFVFTMGSLLLTGLSKRINRPTRPATTKL